MTDKIRILLNRLAPYFIIGVSLAILIAMLVILAHLVVAGIIIGLGIYAFQAIRDRLFGKRQTIVVDREGNRIIEHDPFP